MFRSGAVCKHDFLAFMYIVNLKCCINLAARVEGVQNRGLRGD